MKKRFFAFISAALILSGCSVITDGEYRYSEPHSSSPPRYSDASAVIELASRDELDAVLLDLVERHLSYGRLRFTSYGGDVRSDLADACVKLTGSEPLGAFSVYYVNYSLDLIVSQYEADVSITYKRTAAECAALGEISGDELPSAIEDALIKRTVSIAFYCDDPDFDSAALDAELDGLYFSASSLLYRPEGELISYPASGEKRICEIVFTYPYSYQETASRLSQVELAIDEILDGTDELEGEELISAAALRLAEYAEFDFEKEQAGEYSPWAQAYTAYGALVQRKAAGEGFALAMKRILARRGLDCIVVRGELDGVPHSWNIVYLDSGEPRHIDVSLVDPEAGELGFYTDGELGDGYSWSGDYPVCSFDAQPEAEEAS